MNGDPLQFTDPKGNKVKPYGNVMAELNLSRDDAVAEAEKFGWTIADEQFQVIKGKRGRPKKQVDTCDTSSETGSESGEEKVKKKRGRPKKVVTQEVQPTGAGDDLIANLLAEKKNAKASSTSPPPENDTSSQTNTEDKPVKIKKKVVKTKVLENKDLATEAVTAWMENTATPQVKTEPVAEPEPEPEPEPEVEAEPAPEAELDVEEADEDSDDETPVSLFQWEGKEYYKSGEDILYDKETQEAVGIWNEEEKKIDPYDDEDSDEE